MVGEAGWRHAAAYETASGEARAASDRAVTTGAGMAQAAGFDDGDGTALEERIAHLEREVSDLSAVIAAQDETLRRLRATVERLAQREAERAAEGSGGVVVGDEQPPHW